MNAIRNFFLTALFALPLSSICLAQAPTPVAKPVPTTGDLTAVSSPRYFSAYSNPLTRTPAILLRFDSPVDPAAVAAHAAITDREQFRLPVIATRPTLEQTAPLRPAAPESLEKNSGSAPNPDVYPITHFVRLQPAAPLPYDRTLLLLVPAGLANMDGTRASRKGVSIKLGSLRRFEIHNAVAVSPYENERRLEIRLNKRLLESQTAEKISKLVSLTPKPDNFRIVISGSSITLSGDFKLEQQYKLTLQPGLTAYDQTLTEGVYQKTATFAPAQPFVSLPAFSAPQLSSGSRTFDINAGNLKSLNVRVKKLDDRDLIYALRGYRAYSENNRAIPFEMVPGPTVWEKDHPSSDGFDHIQSLQLDWSEILKTDDTSDPSQTPAALYICAEGSSKVQGDYREFGAQSLIQLTDIGLAWKRDRNHEHIYAFSLASGAPLPGVTLQLTDENARVLRTVTTDPHGLARLPRSSSGDEEDTAQAGQWLLAKLGNDRHAIALDSLDETIGLWRFDIAYQYLDEDSANPDRLGRRTHVFTDRPVYQPGDEVYLKGHTRLTDFDSLLPPTADTERSTTAHLRVMDPRNRTIADTTLNVSQHGSLDHHFTLAEEVLGYHRIELDFNPEGLSPDAEDYRYDLVFYHHLLVAEYRPNTFEITLTPPADTSDTEAAAIVEIPVSARYYMGKPLSKARLQYYANFIPWSPEVKNLPGFSFEHHDHTDASGFGDEIDLSADGSALLELEPPAPGTHSTPLQVSVDATITDINQQTVTKATQFVLHTARHYVGIHKPDETGREKQPLTVQLAAIDREGNPLSGESVSATVSLEKINRHTVKVRGAGGTITTRRHTTYDAVSTTEVQITTSALDPATGTITTTPFSFTPDVAGNYRISVVAANGSAASTKVSVIGENDRDWTWKDEVRLTLKPEKDSYQPGETARLFLDTPVTGHALITIERAHLRQTFTRELSHNRDVLEIPVPEDGAPNLFVSVLIIRGADDSPHQHPAPAFRLGYTQLEIEDPSNALTIELTTPENTYRPAEAIDVTATVRDATGKPLPGTELTLYAVDEGVLSLTGHQTPDPNLALHAPWELRIATGQTLGRLHSEDPEEQSFHNKGYVIGGGGMDEAGSPDRVRKNFKALAFWRGSLITGPDGKVTTSFTAPDNLTEYRLIAVAAKDNRFASTDTPLTIDKPLVLEPSLPAFANVGDDIDLRAVLHNNTDQQQKIEVRLELDETAVFATGNHIPEILRTRSGDTGQLGSEDQPGTRTIRLAARETAAVTFPVQFRNTGTARWKWSALTETVAETVAETVTAKPAATAPAIVTLSDKVESTLEIGYPVPLLRETHHTAINPSDPDADLLRKISPELLNGTGKLRLSASNSRLLEATDALDYLLKYPYGCVEQTTSSTLPWLSTQNLRDALPGLKKTDSEIAAAIHSGTRRLLSMQTQDGGLSYWPGEDQSVLWGSAYGGMVLALARRQGVELPTTSLDDLWTYLSTNLRKTSDIKGAYELSQRTLALYTLALAGKSEPAYHDHLYQRRNELPREARALLALAILETEASETGAGSGTDPRALALLEKADNTPDSAVDWYGQPYSLATSLMVHSHIDPTSSATNEVINELLNTRQGRNAWGSTYRNAWPLLALSTHTRATLTDLQATEIEVQVGDKLHSLALENRPDSSAIEIPFEGGLSGKTLTLTPKEKTSTPLFAHVEIEAYPELTSTEAVSKAGFAIDRRYEKIAPDGTLSPADDLSIGDLVLITLDLTIPEKQHYLAIDDPLPAIFEAINPEFESQSNQSAPQQADWRKRLYTQHKELRKDRALFFCDYLYRAGDYQLQYLARVAASGEATAPAARIEAMYQPQDYALSATTRIAATPLIPDTDGEAKARAKVAAR